MEELLRDADAGLDLALRWLTALAVAHCRPRLPPPSSAAGAAAGGELGGDTDMADAAGDPGTGAEDSSATRMNGLQSHGQGSAAGDGAANAAATPKDPRGPPASLKPSEAADEAGTEGAASKAGPARPWGGLAGSPYEAALLALVKACRWREESLSVAQSGRGSSAPLCCQGQGTMLRYRFARHKVDQQQSTERPHLTLKFNARATCSSTHTAAL